MHISASPVVVLAGIKSRDRIKRKCLLLIKFSVKFIKSEYPALVKDHDGFP
jgi:hypothetical protein